MLEIDDKTTRSFSDKSYLHELITLIEENNYILKMLCHVKLVLGMVTVQKGQYDVNEKQVLEMQLENYEIEEDMTEEVKEKFKNIYRQLNSHDYGEILEYLVQTKGPYFMEHDFVNYTVQSKVYNENITTNHNFDVIFYLKGSRKNSKNHHIIIEDEAEFHECKNNISNWIPNDKKRLHETRNFKKAVAKLEFCKNTYHASVNSHVCIPTFTYDVRTKQACLDSWGYDFIKILGIKELMINFS